MINRKWTFPYRHSCTFCVIRQTDLINQLKVYKCELISNRIGEFLFYSRIDFLLFLLANLGKEETWKNSQSRQSVQSIQMFEQPPKIPLLQRSMEALNYSETSIPYNLLISFERQNVLQQKKTPPKLNRDRQNFDDKSFRYPTESIHNIVCQHRKLIHKNYKTFTKSIHVI